MLHIHPLFRIYFGDAKDQLDPEQYYKLSSIHNIVQITPFSSLKKMLEIEHLVFLRQTHSSNGLSISNTANIPMPFLDEGDFIITNQKYVGLGVMTADCLPLIIFDPVNNVIGIAHAGWRGSVKGIAVQMLEEMQKEYQISANQVIVYFGPVAHVCCYQVQPDFYEQLSHIAYAEELIQKRGDDYYFDVIQCNKRLLEDVGVLKASFHEQYSACTICDHSFYSHRRAQKGRQMTVVSLV